MRPARPNPPHAAGIAPARWLAAAAGVLAATAGGTSADDQPRPAANIQQARAKFAATNAVAFIQAPVAESIKAALAPPGESRLAESIEAVRSLANDLRGDRPGTVIRTLITGADDGTHCPVDPVDPSWIDPPTVRPAGGRTYVRLSAQFAESTVGPERIRHRSYNGALVGPVIRVRPGDTLVVDLANNLPPEPPAPAPAGAPQGAGAAPPQKETPHGFNTTNLHTHGLHVSPLRGADDVFLELGPGARPPAPLRFQIPTDHPAGTFWYHPHKHGSAAIQLTSGMAGALIVEGGIDDHPQIRGAVEKVMVLQQVVYQPASAPGQVDEIRPEDIYSPLPTNPKRQTKTLINGQLVPVISMRPGEVQRWRMIHSGIQTEINVNFPGGKMIEVAYDGIPLKVYRPVVGPSKLEPGYRVDLLIKASNQQGTYCVYNSVTDPLAFNGKTSPPRSSPRSSSRAPPPTCPSPTRPTGRAGSRTSTPRCPTCATSRPREAGTGDGRLNSASTRGPPIPSAGWPSTPIGSTRRSPWARRKSGRSSPRAASIPSTSTSIRSRSK